MIPADRKIDSVALAIILVGLVALLFLLSPQTFDRLRSVEGPGFKLALDEVKAKVAQQEDQLETMRLMQLVLLQKKQQDQLLNLASDNPEKLQGNHTTRQELRQLRSLGLVKMSAIHQHMAEIQDALEVNPQEYVVLTDQGKLWVEKIKEIRKKDTEE
ncbi:MAG: hypothetical protein WCF84_19750 [Anaerolineae bacterium]